MRGTQKLQKIMNNALLFRGLVSRIVKEHAGVASPSLLEIRFSQNITCNLMAISGRRFSPSKKKVTFRVKRIRSDDRTLMANVSEHC